MKKAKKVLAIAAVGIGLGLSTSAYSYPTCDILLNMCKGGIAWACQAYEWDCTI